MTDQQSTTRAKDPVCGMEVDPTTAQHSSEYRGQDYYFCSLMCLNAFEDDPSARVAATTGFPDRGWSVLGLLPEVYPKRR